MERTAAVSVWGGSAPAEPARARGEFSVSGLVAGGVGFFFAFRVAIVLVMVRGFLTDAQTGAATGLALNFLLLIPAVLVSAGPARISLRAMLRVPPLRWVAAFLGMSGCSLLWTRAASPAAAATFWAAMAADVLIVVVLTRACPPEDIGAALMKGYVWGACALAALAWIMPAESDLRLGDEELLGPNTIGYVCALAALLAQYVARKLSRSWNIPGLFLAITLLRTLSKTSIAAFVAGEAFILLRDRSMKRSMKFALAVLAVVMLLAFQGLIVSYYDIYSNAGNQAETLSGRLGIWAYFLTASFESPWIGHGFHSIWKVVPAFGPFEARHAHDEWLQQFYVYGAPGVVLVAMLYTSVVRCIRRFAYGPEKAFLLGFVIFILVRGLAESEAFDLCLPLWLAALISLMLMESTFGRTAT